MDEIKHREQVDLIREVFYYQNRFDGKTIVLKIDYPILNAPHFPQLLKDLAMLRATGIEIILVPGAREWIDAVLKEYDIESEYVDGIRIATQDSIPFIRMAAFDVANRLMTLLTAFQANAVIGNFIRARGIGVVDGVDFQNSGRVEKILKEPLQQILDQGMIPIFPCIGWNAAGKPYNLSSDDIAVAVAEALQAEKLFFVTDSDGFMETRFTASSGPGQEQRRPGRTTQPRRGRGGVAPQRRQSRSRPEVSRPGTDGLSQGNRTGPCRRWPDGGSDPA